MSTFAMVQTNRIAEQIGTEQADEERDGVEHAAVHELVHARFGQTAGELFEIRKQPKK